MIKKSFCLAVTLLSLTAASMAADPDQVGDYTGAIKSKVYTGTTKTNVKSEFLLSIAADDQTTVTIGGVQVDSDGGFKGATGLLLFLPDPTTNTVSLAALEFKKGRFKGTAVGVQIGPPVKTFESKISLKKVAP
jgi:hypothetical protein